MKFLRILLLLLIVTSLYNCSEDDEPITPTPPVTPMEPVIPDPMVNLTQHSNLGMILTDENGKSLYFFSKDAGISSTCVDGCATTWPPYNIADLKVGNGLTSSDFGSITRADGSSQTTYKGWPLYYYSSDANAGDATGDGLNDVWFVAKPDYTIMLANNQLTGADGVNYNGAYEAGDEEVQYFVDGSGLTLYAFVRDRFETNNFTREDFSNDAVWPIYKESLNSIASTLDASLFSTINVHGQNQLAYKGWPIYYFGEDAVRGENKGVSVPAPGVWPVVEKDLPEALPAPKQLTITAHPTLGNLITDQFQNTLYFFTKDAGSSSNCNGNCATNWPVFYDEELEIGSGIDEADVAVITRDDGSMQTTYKGWPLYYFVNDESPGDVNGEGANEVWFVAKPDYSVMLVNAQLLGRDGVLYNSSYEPGEEEVQYLVDDYGRTLYGFVPDRYDVNNYTREDFSNDGTWPIYGEELGSVPSTMNASLFNIIDVHGRQQFTYKGWPLYYFGPDNMERGSNIGVSVPRPGVWPIIPPSIVEATREAQIQIAEDATLGKILTDENGNVLYFFTRDADGQSLCSGGCANNWPIYSIDEIKVGNGLDLDDFGSISRDDGTTQTTYKGWPLYYFVNDAAPGETNGEGANKVWYVAKPDYKIMLVDNQLVGADGIEYTGTYEAGQGDVQYFVDDYGRTLYTFVRDFFNVNSFTNEDFSNDGVWPIYQNVDGAIPSSMDATLFDIIDVFDKLQLTYNGWPLYYFGPDGDGRGNNTGVSVPSPGIWPVAVQTIAAAAEFCDTETVTYTAFVDPLMKASCAFVGCHGGSNPSAGLLLTDYNVVKGLADSGRLYGSIAWESGFSRMPRNQDQLDDCTIDKIKSWIDAGALNN